MISPNTLKNDVNPPFRPWSTGAACLDLSSADSFDDSSGDDSLLSPIHSFTVSTEFDTQKTVSAFQPRTELGRKLADIRRSYIEKGGKLYSAEELEQEYYACRGGSDAQEENIP